MLSKLFRDCVETHLAVELPEADRKFMTRLGDESRKDPQSADTGIRYAVVWEFPQRALLVSNACVKASASTPGQPPQEVLEFAQSRFLAEYGKLKNAVEQARARIPERFLTPLDLSYELHNGMSTLLHYLAPAPAKVQPPTPARVERSPSVFISHSSLDSEVARLMVGLLRAALPLSSEQIRCTSVDGYCLPAGADIDERLRDEILGAHLLVAIMSCSSFESAYVLFELGARWGARQCLVPVLAPGMHPANLRGPVAGLNALSCDNQAQLHQLVSDAAGLLGVIPERPQVYQAQIDAIIAFARSQPGRAPF
jgi:hypothetical protein